MASLTPSGRRAWITGLIAGAIHIGARLVFSDGVESEAQSKVVRVVPPAPPPAGSVLVAEGDLKIPPFQPGGTVRDWSGWAPFTTTEAGRIDVLVDWISPLNRIDFSGYEGHCNAVGSCGMIRMSLKEIGGKPLTATFDSPNMPPGHYTVRIDNLGPGDETVHYEVRLTPN